MEPVKVLFASCSPELFEGAVRTALSVRPELPLEVLSESAPPAGRWIPYERGWNFFGNFRLASDRLDGKQIEVALIVLQPGAPYRRLRLIGVLLRPDCILAVNENLDYFEVHPEPSRNVLVHIRWRMNEWASRTFRRPEPFVMWRARVLGWWIGLGKTRRTPAPETMAAPRSNRPAGVSVVIPSRNGREMLARMLPAVVAQVADGETIVVDNGSEDGSADFVREHFPSVTVLPHVAPLAFAAAVNIGVRAARFSHVCPLNNDMAVAPDFFRQLQRAFERFPGLFCAAPQVFLAAGVPRQETGKMVIRSTPAPSDFPLRSALPIPGEDLTYVLYGSSGCSLFDAERLASLGGFDEAYAPAYVEDLDLGVRAWQRGWPSVFAAAAHVVHEHRATMSRLYSKAQLDNMVVQHWLLFLARTVRDRDIFARYWRHAIARYSGGMKLGGTWRAPRRTAVLGDAEIFALCDGSVTVFPRARADPGRAALVASPRLALPPGAAADEDSWNRVLVCFVDEAGPIPPELRDKCCEIVTVQGNQDASFRAALRQTIRKWRPIRFQLASVLARYASDCAGEIEYW